MFVSGRRCVLSPSSIVHLGQTIDLVVTARLLFYEERFRHCPVLRLGVRYTVSQVYRALYDTGIAAEDEIWRGNFTELR